MKSKKKNEMEKAQNTKGAAQELDMDALEDVSGGFFVSGPGIMPKPAPWPEDFIKRNKRRVEAASRRYNK